MPFEMSGYVQSVIVQGTAYLGGGIAGVGSDNKYTVMAYDSQSGKWAKLPPYRACYFAITAINKQLVLVGGVVGSDKSKVVGMWRPDSEKWTYPYPNMIIARNDCSAVSYKQWLVVAGGERDNGDYLSSVEIMNINTKQWSVGPPLPIPWAQMKTAILGDMWYFMGGFTKSASRNVMYSISLPALLSNINAVWKVTSQLNYNCSTPLSINGSLLAIGGKKNDEAVSAIHLFLPDTGEWVKVGDLPTPRYNCTCAVLKDNEVLVAGGYDGYVKLKRSTLVLIK